LTPGNFAAFFPRRLVVTLCFRALQATHNPSFLVRNSPPSAYLPLRFFIYTVSSTFPPPCVVPVPSPVFPDLLRVQHQFRVGKLQFFVSRTNHCTSPPFPTTTVELVRFFSSSLNLPLVAMVFWEIWLVPCASPPFLGSYRTRPAKDVSCPLTVCLEL